MESLINCFALKKHEVISIIGSGGKTSLLRYLAKTTRHEKILTATTTKMGLPKEDDYDYLLTDPLTAIPAKKGITMVGAVTKTPERSKLSMSESSLFPKSFTDFDKVILESDGSKQLPLKGWADFEPVILPETTMTIGIVPITVLGLITAEETIHRLNLYLKMVKAEKGETVTIDHLVQLIEHPQGLFAKAKGEKILYLNHADKKEELSAAKRLTEKLSDTVVDKVVAGSTLAGKGKIIWVR